MSLPEPGRQRWTILRAGILDVWEFDRQEFIFHQGRLILRGRNESGKSKTLELLLPFLLDASLRPERLSAERNSSRRMYWNLLNEHNSDRKNRTGYLWLEFGRLEGTAPRTLTIGAGLNARRDDTDVTAWYFVTTKRIGEGLSLVGVDDEVLSRKRLVEVLGEDGHVYDEREPYRKRLNDELFDMEPEQYNELVNTLLELRQPKLSKNLDVNRVSELLAASLPPLDADVVGRLATDFEELEEHRTQVKERREAARNVKETLRIARRYASTVSRQRGEALTSADSQLHKANGTLRDRQSQAEAARAAVAANTALRKANERTSIEKNAEYQTFKLSDAYRAVEQIEDRQRERKRLHDDLVAAQRDATESTSNLERKRAEFATQGQVVTEALADEGAEWVRVAEAARASDVDPIAWAEQREVARAWTHKDGVRNSRTWVAEPRAALVELQALDGRVAGAQVACSTADTADSLARIALEEARIKRDQAAQRHDEEDKRWRQALATWSASVGWSTDIGNGPEQDVAPRTAQQHANSAGSRAREHVQHQLEGIAEKRGPLDARRIEVVAEITRLTSDPHPEPIAPKWRDARTGAGAPFYLLCDFAPGADAAVAARLEGALAASGLLDAWVNSDGTVTNSRHDVVAIPSPSVEGPSLREWLVPSDHGAVSASIVDGILRSIRVVERIDASSPDGFDLQGGWRQGVLHGLNPQDDVRYVGATARERERERLLRILGAELEAIKTALLGLDAQSSSLRTDLADIDKHLGAFPDYALVDKTQHDLAGANRRVAEQQSAADAAARALADARAVLQQARDALHEGARRLHRSTWLDRLAELAKALTALDEVLGTWAASAREVGTAQGKALALQRTFKEAEQRAATGQASVTTHENRLAEADATLRALRATLEGTPEEILARATALRSECEALEVDRKALEESRVDVERAGATADAAVTPAVTAVDAAIAERERAHAAFAVLVRLGLARLVLEADADPLISTLTDAIALAREVARTVPELETTPKAIENAENALTRRYEELKRQLPRDFALELEHREGIAVIEARSGEALLSLDELERRLRAELAAQESLLADEEALIFSEFLTGATRRHLRDRLVRATELIERANAVLLDCPTPQGTRIRLKWTLGDEAPPAAQSAIDILRRDSDVQTTGDRNALQSFLQERLARARDEEGSLKERMLELLDYREWHCFELETTGPGQKGWQKLTAKAHGAGSGGQKAVLLHLPLFAAAAAFYASASPNAPRLVLLDEAFAGVDPQMRADLMGLLCRLEIDFVLTSFNEWGCYPSVDGTAIYQLTRLKGAQGVLAERYVWDGTVRTALGDTTP